MSRTTRRGRRPGGLPLGPRVLWALAALALVVAPAFDLASAHTRPADASGARCPLHANPGLTAEPVPAPPAFVGQVLGLIEPLARHVLVPPSIFIPPRS